MTYEIDFVACERAMVGHFQFRKRTRARHCAYLLSKIASRVNGDHARCFMCFAHVHVRYACVRVHRAQERNVQRVRQAYIINVMTQSLNQSRVFRSLYSLSYEFVWHRFLQEETMKYER